MKLIKKYLQFSYIVQGAKVSLPLQMSDYSILSRYFQRSPGIPLVYFLNQGSTM
jgi:hypothetical protein